MESSGTSVEAGLPLQTALQPPDQETALSPSSDPPVVVDPVDPMEEFGRRLSDIILDHGSAQAFSDEDKMEDEVSDVSKLLQTLEQLSSPEDKVEELLQRFTRLALSHQRQQGERCSSQAARLELERLCRDLTSYFAVVREEALQRSLQDAEKRADFQKMLTEIQSQIQTHSARNDKLCQENAALTEKLETLVSQSQQRDESLEKMDKHHELQLRLAEAKLQQAEAQLADATDRHKREKEYLLREAIEKTKKCFTMKEQELNMKKKLTLYSQKFDEFQETLSKSNEIYVRFKKEMENMSEKMKKLEKESNVWKTRFENCNKALNDVMQERTERGHEYDVFVLKIQRLEKLCRALQEERSGLYRKIKEVQQAQSQGCAQVQKADPVLCDNMARLKEEQLKLQEFAAALLSSPAAAEEEEEQEEEELSLDQDLLASAFLHFQTKTSEAPGPAAEELPATLEPEEAKNPETQSHRDQ
ncbi:beta-taxilin isoform 1-T2 [Synchiropus picturatus]